MNTNHQHNYYLGMQRSRCMRLFNEQNLPTVMFANWVIAPDLDLVLTFKFQQCVAVECIEST